MNNANRPITEQMKDFFSYINTLFGYLSGITLFFPLANQFFEIVPLPNKNPVACVYFATLTGTFIFFYQFARRDTHLANIENGVIFFVSGLIIALIYIEYPIWWWVYIVIFSAFTLAFSELAVVEFQKTNEINPTLIKFNKGYFFESLFKMITELINFLFKIIAELINFLWGLLKIIMWIVLILVILTILFGQF